MSSDDRPVILVIEDDPITRDLLRQLFAGAGYVVLPAADGDAALSALTTIRPDLVTLDLDLPGISGAEVLTSIRRVKGLRRLYSTVPRIG